ncbi:phosphopantothenoylcysteine decarboxylase/phosphopantothenate--cysteine ligase [Synechococcus sp. PCC 7502]|uniref:bifunctional phosphopantothenoylcysteine decarboxylase/phosphopantothenate--cysteine ligase CoaBC n=1 Tax=Synechococcus sp. PCC 7502 TaxID=1173263 RepID=UPI00029FC07D|nr:bifunctional phosphopantothenoylcysteine decarboxylase/phosphopantothenate--cysteine ligase CoaBC [Synechococcus sp. PCC 7502]AFY72249.1 phosphopantothenoylcysteine decarboxylase/phosphopantothenate--cysteine ligase [Synechococcus sp. PCC 7502]
MSKRVLIGVTGGIAAYKVCEVVSTLAKNGIEVRVILTESAEAFVSGLTFATLSRNPAYSDRNFWQPTNGKPLHIELADWADVFVIAPLSANTLAKLVWGLADNLLTNTVLASRCPLLVAPAMNTTMWESVQNNWQSLLTNPRIRAIAPSSGILACDAVGNGRMAEPEVILNYIESVLWTKGNQDLMGKNILVSAGGTREFIDPVRFIGNPATGKQGIAIAQAAHHRGANVTLVTANPSLNLEEFKVIAVQTSAQMHRELLSEFTNTQPDLTIMAAAVGDVKPKYYSDRKLPKSELPSQLELESIPDILQELSKHKQSHQKLIGFAAQTGTTQEIINAAQLKLQTKNLDAIAANQVNSTQTGFATDTNQATFIRRNGVQTITPLCSKLELAHRLLDFVLKPE